MTRKKALAALLATLQIAWSFSWGAYEAVAQVVYAPTASVPTGGVPGIPASAVGAFCLFNQTVPLAQGALTAAFVPGLQPMVPMLTPGAALSPAALTAASLVTATPPASIEENGRAGDAAFAALYPEALIQVGERTFAGPVSGRTATSLRPDRLPILAAAKVGGPVPVATLEAKAPAAPVKPLWYRPLVRVAAFTVVASVAGPILAAYVGVVAAAGSVALSVIGIPQIVKNFKAGRDGVKDLAIASPLIWFAAATMLSVVSIGSGASLWWNVANVAGVIESGVVVAQIDWHKRDAKELKATGLTAAAVLGVLPLIAGAVFMPLSSWLTVSFAAAMGLLWVLNWPQIRQNLKIFEKEGRAPQGIAPMYPALVIAGSLLHFYAAVMGGDLRWAINASIGILTAAIVLAQIYAPRATNSVVGPIVRLIERLLPGKAAPADADALQAKARALIAPILPSSLSRHVATDGGRAMSLALQRAKALPGRSVVFLEAPTAAGKSTLAEGLHTSLGPRIKVFPVDRYFKPRKEVPVGPDGQPDFDRPESLYLDRVAADMRTLLAGGRVELPLNDMVTQTTRFDSGEFMVLGGDEVLIVDSIYALHAKLISAAKGRRTLNLYLHAPAVVRLARRLSRDRRERGISADTNLSRWPVILQDEIKFILPLKRRAHLVVNLISAPEIEKLLYIYGSVLAAEWAAHGEDPALTARFLEGIRSSLAADADVP
ncbi:MAG: hypothetical protein AAB268_13975 [Elusimicrobiota bacterium]